MQQVRLIWVAPHVHALFRSCKRILRIAPVQTRAQSAVRGTEEEIWRRALSFYSLWQPVSADLCIILICGITCLVIENYINFRGKCVRACRTSSTPAQHSTVIVWVLSHLGKSGNKLAKISERMPIFIPLRARIDRCLPPPSSSAACRIFL